MHRYELIYGFVHCRGKTTYHAGYAQSRAEADEWLRRMREPRSRTMKVPPEDPIRWCKAAICPFKRQKAWFEIKDLKEAENRNL